MPNNRKETEAYICHWVDQILPGSPNKQMYIDLFAAMDDKQFEEFMRKIETEEYDLAIIAPNLHGVSLSLERNLQIAKDLGHEFFERIWINAEGDVPSYLSHHPYLIIDLPLRRQAQLLVKKISIPQDNKSVDDLTGQPTGKSKGSKISYPETMILAALNLDSNLIELLKYRGGDTKGFNAMNDSISRTGGVRLETIEALGSTVKSTETLKIFLLCMHLDNTLVNQ